MMVMTAKVDKKKILMIVGIIAAAALGLMLLFGGGGGDEPTVSTSAGTNDGRVEFLEGFGWEVTTSPKESGKVRIPAESSEVFDRYNRLQKSQGYDLSAYAGKTVMRYVYTVNNYPGATEPVYATLLVYKNQIIGGDITDTAAGGVIRGFKKPQSTTPQTTLPSTTPSDPTGSAGNKI